VCAKLWEEENKAKVIIKFWRENNVKGLKPEDKQDSQVLKEGWLLKQGNTLLKDWKHRWFVLKKDYIAYYKSPEVSGICCKKNSRNFLRNIFPGLGTPFFIYSWKFLMLLGIDTTWDYSVTSM
jgi:hypothetical protein